jgi:hypothetical protein
VVCSAGTEGSEAATGRVLRVRRLFWFSLGAASAVWATRRGEAALREVQSRGVLGTVELIAGQAARLVEQIDTSSRARHARAHSQTFPMTATALEDDR